MIEFCGLSVLISSMGLSPCMLSWNSCVHLRIDPPRVDIDHSFVVNSLHDELLLRKLVFVLNCIDFTL